LWVFAQFFGKDRRGVADDLLHVAEGLRDWYSDVFDFLMIAHDYLLFFDSGPNIQPSVILPLERRR